MYNIRGMCRSHANTPTHTNARALRQKRARVVYWTSLGVKSNNADTPQCNCLTRVFKGATHAFNHVLDSVHRGADGRMRRSFTDNEKNARLFKTKKGNFIKSWLLKPFTAVLKWKMMALSVELLQVWCLIFIYSVSFFYSRFIRNRAYVWRCFLLKK